MIRDSFDDDLDELDLVQMADPSLLQSPVIQPKDFSWSDDASLDGPVSPKSGDGMASNVWDLSSKQPSSARTNRSMLPDTMPLSTQALGNSLPSIDLSETASTAQRSSPFQTDEARQQLWDLDDELEEDAGFLGDFSNANVVDDKTAAFKIHSLAEDAGHLSSSEIYEATPAKQRTIKATPTTQSHVAVKKNMIVESSPAVRPLTQPAKAKQSVQVQKHKLSPAESPRDIHDEIDDIAAALSKRQPTADAAPSSEIKSKAVKKSKQRPKSPLKFDEDTQKIKSPGDKPIPKAAAKPAQKSTTEKTTKTKTTAAKKGPAKPRAAKKPARRSTRNKAPAAEDTTSDAAVAVQDTKDHPPVLQLPTPKVQQEPKIQKASTPKPKARVAPPESPIVLSSDHGSLYQPSPDVFTSQVVRSPVIQRHPIPDEELPTFEELFNAKVPEEQNRHEENVAFKPLHVNELVTKEIRPGQRAGPPKTMVEPANQTQELSLDSLQQFQRLRNRTTRAISVSDAGSPFAKLNKSKPMAARLNVVTPQHANETNTEELDIRKRSKYPSPLFQVTRNQRDRRALVESPDTPNRSARDATGPPSFVLHENPKRRGESHRKSSDWARILSLNKEARAKKTQETVENGRLLEPDEVVETRPRTTDRPQSSAGNQSKLAQKIHAVAEVR